jgi:hypothetical protein
LRIAARIDVIAPHPLARLEFDGCRVPADALVGAEGEGFKLAMRTLDIFRASVAAAAVGFARRALHEALRHARAPMFGATLGDLQLPGETGRDGDRDRRRCCSLIAPLGCAFGARGRPGGAMAKWRRPNRRSR